MIHQSEAFCFKLLFSNGQDMIVQILNFPNKVRHASYSVGYSGDHGGFL